MNSKITYHKKAEILSGTPQYHKIMEHTKSIGTGIVHNTNVEMKNEKYFDKARQLRNEDIDRKVMKVKCVILLNGLKDASYMNEIYTLKSIEYHNQEIFDHSKISSFTLIDSKGCEKIIKSQYEHRYYNDWICLDEI